MLTRFILKSRIDRCPSFWVLLIAMALVSGFPAQAATFTVTNLNDTLSKSVTLNTASSGAAIASSQTHTIALKSNGTVWAWGDNRIGALGDGTTIQRTTPVQVIGLDSVIAIAAGWLHTIALRSDGTVWVWGNNLYGPLEYSLTPVQVIGLNSVMAIAAGYDHSIALKNDGTVWAWGQNNYGQLGDGTTTRRTIPVQVIGLNNMMAIAGGVIHTIALKNDGTVWAWGQNNYGQLGDGTTTRRTIPVQVIGLNSVIAIAAGSEHTVALNNDGTVWTWGRNSMGQLGNGTFTSSATPVSVSSLSDVVATNAGDFHTIALKNDGTVWAWGQNNYGQLGDGTTTERPTPKLVTGLNNSIAIGTGSHHTIALKNDGTVWTWGLNEYGELGDGTTTQRTTPIQVHGAGDVGFLNLFDAPPVYTLTVLKTGSGTVTSTPVGITCGGTCTAEFNRDTQVTLTAKPDTGYSFTGWSGACNKPTGTCTVKMDAAQSVTALFANIPAFTLRVTKIGNGSGTVTSTPAGINCGSDCTESYPTNTLVKLTAAPLNASSAFVGWSGACTGTATVCTVKVDAAKTATANFKRVAALTVAKSGSGAGRISGPGINCGLDCAETYDLNTVVTLTAAAYSGSTLIGWFNCPANPAPNQCRVTMSASRTVAARFNTTTAGKTALTFYKAGAGLGTVTSTPAGITCGPTCPVSVFNFPTGATVVLNAVETTGSTFTGWSGCTVDPNNRRRCAVTLNTGKVVSATFARPVLTVRKVGSGLVATPSGVSTGIFCGTDCTEAYNLNTPVTLIAIPATGYRFTGWSGCTVDPGFPQMCTALMNQSRTATARFIR